MNEKPLLARAARRNCHGRAVRLPHVNCASFSVHGALHCLSKLLTNPYDLYLYVYVYVCEMCILIDCDRYAPTAYLRGLAMSFAANGALLLVRPDVAHMFYERPLATTGHSVTSTGRAWDGALGIALLCAALVLYDVAQSSTRTKHNVRVLGAASALAALVCVFDMARLSRSALQLSWDIVGAAWFGQGAFFLFDARRHIYPID